MLGSAIVAETRSSARSSAPLARELISALLSRSRRRVLALRGGELAAYHGAEHITIGAYEHGEARPKEHERCGSHLLGPMLLTTAAANVGHRARARALPDGRARGRRGRRGRGVRRAVRLDDAPSRRIRSRARSRSPATSSSTGSARASRARRSSRSPTLRCGPVWSSRHDRRRVSASSRRLRPAGREDARRLVHGRVLQPHARGAPAATGAGRSVVMQVFQKKRRLPRRHGRGDRDPQAVRRRLRRARRCRRSTTATRSRPTRRC